MNMKKKRENSYFGIHFDFHATEGEIVANRYEPEVVAELLDRVKPDFVQCDTKGHAGFSSYPTNAGTRAFEIKEDILKMWRSLTEERDIALYGHHSGLYDMQAAKNHPDWAIKDEYGNISSEYISPFSPYADKILIPQLKELALDYKLDGAWIDGECWGAMVDYSDFAVKKYFEKTGKKPPVRGDSNYEEYREFCRDGFSDYVTHYITEIKKVRPDFEITSNWIFSAYMPVEPNVKVDFLSGDYDSSNSLASARYNGRCLANKNMTWDLMAWGQNAYPCSWSTKNRNTKEYIQYCQEAAEIISLGGAFQFFNIMYGSGGCVQKWAIPMWEKVAKFVREREAVCHKAKPLPEIAVLYPEEKSPHNTENLYVNDYDGYESLKTWVDALQNIQLSCQVLNEYQLDTKLSEYKVLVVPDTEYLKEKSADTIYKYIQNGGKVICDAKSVKYFSQKLCMTQKASEEKLIFVDGKNNLAATETLVLSFDAPKSKICTKFYNENFYDENPNPASYITQVNDGKIITLCFDFSNTYKNNISTAIEDFVKQALDNLDFEPVVKVLNNHFADVIVTKKENKLIVNLVNYAGPHALQNVRSYNEIPPLCDIKLEIIYPQKPAKIYIEPEHKGVRYEYKNGKITLTVDKLLVHSAITIE